MIHVMVFLLLSWFMIVHLLLCDDIANNSHPRFSSFFVFFCTWLNNLLVHFGKLKSNMRNWIHKHNPGSAASFYKWTINIWFLTFYSLVYYIIYIIIIIIIIIKYIIYYCFKINRLQWWYYFYIIFIKNKNIRTYFFFFWHYWLYG